MTKESIILYSYPGFKVVEVRSGGGVVEVYKDARHTDFVRGLAWKEDTLWYFLAFFKRTQCHWIVFRSAGWDGKVFSHGWVPSHNQQ